MDEIKRRDFLALGMGLISTLAADGLNIDAYAATMSSPTHHPDVPMKLTLKGNSLSLRASWVDIPDWRLALEADNNLLESQDARIEIIQDDPLHIRFHFSKPQLTWEIQSEIDSTANRLLLYTTIRNESLKAVKLGRVFLFKSDMINGFFNSGDSVVYLPFRTGQGLNQVKDLNSKDTISDIAIQAFNQSQVKALQVGFASFLRAKTQIEHQCDSAKSFQVKAWCDFDGWELSPKISTPTETLTMAVGENPYSQMETWTDTAVRLCNIRPRQWQDQAHGWLGWAWVDPLNLEVERYEDIVFRNAKSIQKRLAGFGIDYVWISMGNIKDGQPGAWLDWNERYFPNGHKYLHDGLEQLGMKWGLWCGAFMFSSKLADKVKEFGDAIIKQPDGKHPLVFGGAWFYALDSPKEDPRKPIYSLDPSHPKTLKFLKEVFETYRNWGVRYYMVDFLWAGADHLATAPRAKHYDKTLVSGPEVFRKGLQVIRDAAGNDTYLLGATGPTYHSAGVVDAMRIGDDFGEGRPVVRGFPTYPATFPLTQWNGPVQALSNHAANYHTHQRLYINNSGNVLSVDKPIRLNQAQVNATIHALSGGPSMLGDDITYIEDERLSLIKKTLPRPKNLAVPVDLFSRKEQGCPRIYHRKIASQYGTYDVVAIFNLESAQPIRQDLDLKLIGLDENRSYHVWEFWNSEYSGKVRKQLSVEIPSYTVKVYRLTEDTGSPIILGTDMHVLMGEVEIGRYFWDANRQTFSGLAIRPQGEEGNIFVYGPPKIGVADPKGYMIGKDIKNNCLVIRCPLQFDRGTAEWSLRFYNLTT